MTSGGTSYHRGSFLSVYLYYALYWSNLGINVCFDRYVHTARGSLLLGELVAFRFEPGKKYSKMASLIFTDPGEAVISFCSSSLIYPRPFLFTASWCPLVCFLVSKVFSLMQDSVASFKTWLHCAPSNCVQQHLRSCRCCSHSQRHGPHADIAHCHFTQVYWKRAVCLATHVDPSWLIALHVCPI